MSRTTTRVRTTSVREVYYVSGVVHEQFVFKMCHRFKTEVHFFFSPIFYLIKNNLVICTTLFRIPILFTPPTTALLLLRFP